MSNPKIEPTKSKRRYRRGLALGATALAMATLPAGTAQAEWYFSKAGAQRVTKDFVSKHYADTYRSDLSTHCRPQGRRAADPRYKYHRWVCAWYDSSDETEGVVLIVGSNSPGAYYGKVLRGAH